jgi:cell division protease FtsH
MKITIILMITLTIQISFLSPVTIDDVPKKKLPIFATISSAISAIKNKIFNFINADIFFEDPEYYKNITFESIIGFSNQKTELTQSINNIIKKNNKKKIFFFIGPEGMQKIKFSYAVANVSKLPIIIINPFDEIKPVSEVKEYFNRLFSFLEKNTPCILYIKNIQLIGTHWRDFNEQQEITNYIENKIKKIDGITCIFDGTQFNQLSQKSIQYKTILFNVIENDDCIALIKFYLNKYNLVLENDDLINKLSNLFANMTIDEIDNNIDNLNEILLRKNQEKVTEDSLNELSNEIKNNRKITVGNNQIDTTEFVKDKTLDDIWGYKSIKKKLFNLLPTLKNKNKKQKGILFSGPAGTGKTQMIRALAGSAGIRFITVNPAELIADGSVHWQIKGIFEKAKLGAPCILFIDEIDVLLTNEIANSSFLIELDGNEELLGVTVIGATNHSHLIDRRIKRSGRMSIEIKVSLPNKDDRTEIIKNYLKKVDINNVEEGIFNQLVEKTINFSGADIKEYIYNIKTYLEENNLENITPDILFNIYIEMILGSKKELLIDEKELIQTAYHEVCHGLLQYILYRQKLAALNFSFLTIEPGNNFLGVSCSIEDDYYKAYTKTYLESDIKILLAGKCSQEIFLKTVDRGATSDLQRATTLAHQYIDKFGMGKRLSVKDYTVSYEDERCKKIINEVEALLQREYKLVKKFLLSYKDLVDIIVKKLLEKKLLHREEFDIIINTYEKTNKKVTF